MPKKPLLLPLLLLVLLFADGAEAWRRRRRSCGRRNGGWSAWGSWNKNCGSERTRSRACNSPAPYCGGSGCPGSSSQRVDTCCPVNGAWTGYGDWEAWGPTEECDVLQTRVRKRTCANPKPSCEGKECEGADNEKEKRPAAGNNCCKDSSSSPGSYWNTGSQECVTCREFCETGLTETTDCGDEKDDGSTFDRKCEDLTAPVITLSGDNPTVQEGGHDFAEPGVTAVDSYDGEIIGRLKASYPDMKVVGESVITYTLTDVAGNAAEAKTRGCKIIDTTAPEITLIGDANQEVHLTHEGGYPYEDPGAVVMDLVDGDISDKLVIEGNDFDDTHVKVHVVKYSCTDAEGNIARAERNVNVIDTLAPEITLIESALYTAEADATAAYTDPGATAEDRVDGDITDKIVMDSSEVDLSNPQRKAYTVTFDVTDVAGLDATTVERKVVVKDTIGPAIELAGDADMVVEAAIPFVEPGYTAVDALDGDLTDKVNTFFKDASDAGILFINTKVADGTKYTITYSSRDRNRNTRTVDRSITVRDTTAPVLTLSREVMDLEVKTEYFEPGYTATDTLDGRITPSVVVDGPYRIAPNGELRKTSDEAVPYEPVGTQFVVKYSVVDKAGNKAEIERKITLVDTTAPQLKLKGTRRMSHEGATPWNDPGCTGTDNYDNTPITSDQLGDVTENIIVNITLDGNVVTALDPMAPAGTEFVITYTLADAAGNFATPDQRKVLIVDTTSPTLTLKAGVTIDYQAGGAESLFADPGWIALDTLDGNLDAKVAVQYRRTTLVEKTLQYDCAGEDQPSTRPQSAPVPVLYTTEAAGTTYTVTYTVSDLSGNAATITREVTLVDTIPPALRLVGEAVQDAEAGTPFRDAGATASDIVSGMLTGCVETAVTNTRDNGAIDLGDVTSSSAGTQFKVTYTTSDDAGLSSTTSRQVNVVDTLAPTLTVLGPKETITRVGDELELVKCSCTDLGDPGIECTRTSTVPFNSDMELEEAGAFATTFTCSDASGHTTTDTGMVRVLEEADPFKREGPTQLKLTLDLNELEDDGSAAAAATTTVASDANGGGASELDVVALQFEVVFTRTANNAATSPDGANATIEEDKSNGVKLANTLKLNSNGVPYDDDSVLPGIQCKAGVCNVLIQGGGGGNLTDTIQKLGGIITKAPLEIVGFEGAIILPDDVDKKATVEFPTLDISTTDFNALNVGLERALGGEVVGVSVLGKFKYTAGSVVVTAQFATVAEAQEMTANEGEIQTFVLGIYRQMVETDGADIGSSPTVNVAGATGDSAEEARARALLRAAGFQNTDSEESRTSIHCTDGVCIYTAAQPPTQAQWDTLANHEAVQTATDVTLKVAPGAQRPWFVVSIWKPSPAEREQLAAAMSQFAAKGGKLASKKCEQGPQCPIIFDTMPSESDLKQLQLITLNSTFDIRTYARETACFEPDLQGGPSNDEGRGLLHVAGLSALDVECSPGTVCCFTTAFPYDLTPLQEVRQVSRVSDTVWGTLAPADRMVIQLLSTSGNILPLQDQIIEVATQMVGPDRHLAIICDTVKKASCALSYDAVQGNGFVSDWWDVDKLRSKLPESLVIFEQTASTGTKGSISFYPAATEVDPLVARYLLVENGIEAKHVDCMPGSCQYVVESTAAVPNQVEFSRAMSMMEGSPKLTFSAAPTIAYPQKAALNINPENAPMTPKDATTILGAAGVIATGVECSGTACIFHTDHLSGEHATQVELSDAVASVVYPGVVSTSQNGGEEYAGSFRAVGDVTLAVQEAESLLLSAGILPPPNSPVACSRGVCTFTTKQNLGGVAAIEKLFALLNQNRNVASVEGPTLVDVQYKTELTVKNAIINAANARPDQVRILNFNASTGEVEFEILPPCGDALEGSLLVADGCLDEDDNYQVAATFRGADPKTVRAILAQAGVDVVDLHFDGATLLFVASEDLTEEQVAQLAANGIDVTDVTRIPVLTVGEIQSLLKIKAEDGALTLPLASFAINITGTNRTADPAPPLPVLTIAIAGGVAALVILAVFIFCCCCGGAALAANGEKPDYGNPGQHISFSNPMYDMAPGMQSAQGYYGQQSLSGIGVFGAEGMYEDPSYGDGDYGDDDYYEEEEDGSGGGWDTGTSNRKCMYEGSHGKCRNLSLKISYYCVSHTCEKEGCTASKASTEKRCVDHKRNPSVKRGSTKRAGSKKGSKKVKKKEEPEVDAVQVFSVVNDQEGFYAEVPGADDDYGNDAATYDDVPAGQGGFTNIGFDDGGGDYGDDATYDDIPGGDGYLEVAGAGDAEVEEEDAYANIDTQDADDTEDGASGGAAEEEVEEEGGEDDMAYGMEEEDSDDEDEVDMSDE